MNSFTKFQNTNTYVTQIKICYSISYYEYKLSSIIFTLNVFISLIQIKIVKNIVLFFACSHKCI